MNKFSVLMSLYAKENPHYLDLCLESISLQTLMPDQVVIVLDGPVGVELEDVIKKWSGFFNILPVKLDENVGLGRALNYGLNFCDNELVARMDTDDICMPDRFEKQLAEFNSNITLSLLGTAIQEFDGDVENVTSVRKVPVSSEEICSFSKYKNPFNHMTVMFKKKNILDAGGYQHHHYMEDYNLWLRLIASGIEARNLSEALVLARTGDAMLKRRKGFSYIYSEYILAKLKYDLKLQGAIAACCIFLLRSLPRLLPTKLLSHIYKISRK
ncbi:glycosyltransferase [Cedecea davisae]|uniref:glycosyltransferase n=1 Tax=Cedecea davisae TaxID=158484 RepID=UPI00376EDC00